METATRDNVKRATVSTVFHDARDARSAVEELRAGGVPNDAITVIARHPDQHGHPDEDAKAGAPPAGMDREEERGRIGESALDGAGIGLGVGALFGLAAALIPGAGPFLAAGALTHALGISGVVVSGAIVGGVTGGIASALSEWGLDEAESRHYAHEIERGGTFASVDLERAGVSREKIQDIFRRHHGRTAGV